MPLDDAADQVRSAAMVDDLCSAAAHCTVQSPVGIECEQVREIAVAAFLGLLAIQPLAGVLDDLTIPWDSFGCEDAVPVNLGTFDFQLETGILFVDFWPLNQVGSHRNCVHFSEPNRSALLFFCPPADLLGCPTEDDVQETQYAGY